MISSFMDYQALTQEIEAQYRINIVKLQLHRAMIGHVYFIQAQSGKYVFKLYRSFNTANAIQSTEILKYLRQNNYPAAIMVPAINGELNIAIDTPEGLSIGILYNFVEGVEPDGDIEIVQLGVQTGALHKLMEGYRYPLINHTKETYIGGFISIMNRMEYDPSKTADLMKYGEELWARICRLPKGFCHGDLHTGNMLRQGSSGNYVLFDFDDASGDYPMMDIAYMSDDTHFNVFDEGAYDATLRKFGRFYQGYAEQRTVQEAEIQAITDFVAVRHYQIIARIVGCKGLQEISHGFLDEQYVWLMNWNNLCEKKRSSLAQ